MSNFISSHNKKLLNSRIGNIKPWNCRKEDEYPLNRKCQAQDVQMSCLNINKSREKSISKLLKKVLRKDTTTTQNHLDTSSAQRKQHYLSIFGKLRRSIIKMPTSIVNSKIYTIVFKYFKEIFIMSPRKA